MKLIIDYTKNTISILQDEEGREISLHAEKVASLWNTFKTRMGESQNPTINFNLDEFTFSSLNLDHLVEPFSNTEIDQVINQMPMDKSPGPDGFNARFLKKCWHIIKANFYQLCQDFYNGEVSLQAINSSMITLVPKVSNPRNAGDFRPISLLNLVLKLITKLLANRLQLVILKLIHRN
jgi:hypothetical protein